MRLRALVASLVAASAVSVLAPWANLSALAGQERSRHNCPWYGLGAGLL